MQNGNRQRPAQAIAQTGHAQISVFASPALLLQSAAESPSPRRDDYPAGLIGDLQIAHR